MENIFEKWTEKKEEKKNPQNNWKLYAWCGNLIIQNIFSAIFNFTYKSILKL